MRYLYRICIHVNFSSHTHTDSVYGVSYLHELVNRPLLCPWRHFVLSLHHVLLTTSLPVARDEGSDNAGNRAILR